MQTKFSVQKFQILKTKRNKSLYAEKEEIIHWEFTNRTYLNSKCVKRTKCKDSFKIPEKITANLFLIDKKTLFMGKIKIRNKN